MGRTTILILALAGTIVCPQAPLAAEGPLFAGDDLLSLTIRGPLASVARHGRASVDTAGTLELTDGTTIPMTFSAYGESRLAECPVPCLEIMVDEAHARGTPFEGHPALRLVTACHHATSYEKYIVLEYLTYKSYAIVAEPALQVRLVSIRFRDSEKPDFDETSLAFFVEDIGTAAERHGKKWLDIQSQPINALDPRQLAVLALFQYMVGNTDWSVLSSAPGERCCHNVAVLGADGDRYNMLLPFDFDNAGLVDAPYAVPDQRLPIQRVTQRSYRGFCTHNDQVPAAVEVFNEIHPRLQGLFHLDGLPNPKARARALKYVNVFYDTINNPRRLKNRILSHCRQAQ